MMVDVAQWWSVVMVTGCIGIPLRLKHTVHGIP